MVCATSSTLFASVSSPVAVVLDCRRSAGRSSRRSRARCVQRARRERSRVFAVVQVLLVADVLEPAEQQGPARRRRPWCGAARSSRSLTKRPNSCSGRSLRLGRADQAFRRTAPRTGSPSSSTGEARRGWPSVWWPMPRLGVVTARRNAGSSSLLTSRRSQAQRSWISARSKKLCPPETLYGMPRLAQRLLERRAPGGWPGRGPRSRASSARRSSRAATRCAPPRARPRAPRRRTRSRAPARRRRDRSTASSRSSFGLWPITALAARRMLPVER